MKDMPMMTCGHQANSMGKRAGETEQRPACVICSCFDVDPNPPDLNERKARCTFYGKRTRRNECSVCSKGDGTCKCERPSTDNLAFFQHHPDKEFDEFYCGCWSWN